MNRSMVKTGGSARAVPSLAVDWILFLSAVPILLAGLVTMYSFTGTSVFFTRQIVWIVIALSVFFAFSFIDWRFLRKTSVVVALFLAVIFLLLGLFAAGTIVKGAQSWFSLGSFSFQPAEAAKLVLIILLSKYFSRRHIEIADIRHLLVSGLYTFALFSLVFLQPDFGSAVIIFLIWFGMVLVSGISKKHVAAVVLVGAAAFAGLWFFVFKDYQKARILTFLHPLADIRGAGYNAFQSMVAVGSGGLFGKGIGYGTQSRLNFLPEYETDFIFAAFAEEWGFVGVFLLFFLYGALLWRILSNALHGASNFETLFGLGLVILTTSHFIIHVGMNIGLLPVTGVSLPFMSYGGTHLLVSFAGLGILMGMRRYRRAGYRELERSEPHSLPVLPKK